MKRVILFSGVRSILKKSLLGFIAALAVLSLMLTGCAANKATIDFEQCVKVTFSGSNGDGIASVNFDTEYLSDVFKDMDTVSATMLLASFKIDTPDNNGALSNGDTVKININADEEVLKNYKVSVKNTELSFTVKGLEEKPSADVFADVSLKVTGASPYCKVEIEYTGALPISKYSFSIKDVNGEEKETFKNGDTVVVKLNVGELSEYKISETEREYKIETDSAYILSPDDLTAERREKLEEAAKNIISNEIETIISNKNSAGSAAIAKLTGYNPLLIGSAGATITSIKNLSFNSAYVGTKYESGSFGSVKEKHYIYYFYEADFTHNYKSTQTIHGVLILQLSEPAADTDRVFFEDIATGVRTDIQTAEKDFITSDFAKLS